MVETGAGAWLRAARLTAGVSLEAAAFRLRDVLPEMYWKTTSTIGRLEQRDRVNPVIAVALATIYDADIDTAPASLRADIARVNALLARSVGRPSRAATPERAIGDASAVRQARVRAGLTQEQLAARAGVALRSVQRAEQGRPGMAVLRKLAPALGVTVGALIDPAPHAATTDTSRP